MSVTDRSERSIEPELDDLPEFDLGYLFDDRDDPTEVTVFPSSDERDISTHWITIDASDAVALEDVR